MIGTFCRSLQHLFKSVEDCKTKKLIFIWGNGRFSFCEAYKKNENEMLIFNSVTNCSSKGLGSCINITKEIEELYNKYGYFIYLNLKEISTILNLNHTFSNNSFKICLLPQDFDKDYEKFRNENNKRFKQVVDKFTSYYFDNVILMAYCLSNGSINFFEWIVRNLYRHVDFNNIFYIMQWNEKYSQNTNKLSKGTITAYNDVNGIMQLIQELHSIRQVKRANDSVVQFNTIQKKLLKPHIEEKYTKEVLNKFGRLSDVKKLNFIRKVSTIEDYDEIISQMAHLCDIHFDWNKASLLDYIKNSDITKCDIVFDKDNLVLIKVNDYETIKRLAKTTNWCISKNKRYWNDYVEHRKSSVQYVLFDFNKKEDDELSIVGFTTDERIGITNAHSFTNNNLMDNASVSTLLSFLPRRKMGIHTILDLNHIPTTIFKPKIEYPFEWSKKSFIEFISKYIDEFVFDILMDEDNKLVVSIKSNETYKLFHPKTLEHFDFYLLENECMFFLDFNKNSADADAFALFPIIPNEIEETNSRGYDYNLNPILLSFNKALSDFGLPFNTIKRVYSVQKGFNDALLNYDTNALREILSNTEQVKELTKHKDRNDNAYYSLYNSIFNEHSLEILNIFYEKGLTLTKFFHINRINDLVLAMFQNMAHAFRNGCHMPTLNEEKMFKKGVLTDERMCYLIAYKYIFDMLLEYETVESLTRLMRNFHSIHYCKGLTEYVLTKVVEKKKGDCSPNTSKFVERVYNYAHNVGSAEMVSILINAYQNTEMLSFIHS